MEINKLKWNFLQVCCQHSTCCSIPRHAPCIPHPYFSLLTLMPQPTILLWILLRSGNSNVHLGAVDISMEEKKVDPKTPAPRKRQNRNQKNMKSAEEVEAWIK